MGLMPPSSIWRLRARICREERIGFGEEEEPAKTGPKTIRCDGEVSSLPGWGMIAFLGCQLYLAGDRTFEWQKKGSPARYDRGRIVLLFLFCLFGHRFFAFALGAVFVSHIITCRGPWFRYLGPSELPYTGYWMRSLPSTIASFSPLTNVVNRTAWLDRMISAPSATPIHNSYGLYAMSMPLITIPLVHLH